MYSTAVILLMIYVGHTVSTDELTTLRGLEEEYWQWRLRESPEFASSVGVSTYNSELTSYNMTVFSTRQAAVLDFYERIQSIDSSVLDSRERIDYQILTDNLETYLDGYPWRYYETLNPMSFLEGLQTNPAHFYETLPFNTLEDYKNYLQRLSKLPLQLSQFLALFEEAIRQRHTLHRVSIEPVPGQIDKLLVDDVMKSPFYLPFDVALDESSVAPSYRAIIREQAKEEIQAVNNALQRLKNYIINDYIPHARTSLGIGQWDGGLDNYRACLRWHLSADVSPQEVHRLGLAEVARIQELMEQTLRRMEFNGSVSDFFNVVREDPGFHLSSAKQLLKKYNDIIYKDIFPKLPGLFKDIPDLPLRVYPMPYDGVGGEYLAGTVDGSRPGIFYVNLFHPQGISTIDMKALSLHETVPGHHLQAIYAMSGSLPAYRRFQEDNNHWQVPFKFPFYTAYLEGWALYAESLGEEMGLYTDDYELMGRYGSEMFRACRMVVDTGLHYYNWDEEQATSFLLAHTGYSRQNVISEVHRYVTWPGQATAYKFGEMKIQQLRRRAMRALDDDFDLREFHNLILQNGPMPMKVLEDIINQWIAQLTFNLF